MYDTRYIYDVDVFLMYYIGAYYSTFLNLPLHKKPEYILYPGSLHCFLFSVFGQWKEDVSTHYILLFHFSD